MLMYCLPNVSGPSFFIAWLLIIFDKGKDLIKIEIKESYKEEIMKVKSLQIGGVNESKTTVTYRKLGKHAYIVNEAIL